MDKKAPYRSSDMRWVILNDHCLKAYRIRFENYDFFDPNKPKTQDAYNKWLEQVVSPLENTLARIKELPGKARKLIIDEAALEKLTKEVAEKKQMAEKILQK